jgi:hypothetical protein
VGLSIVRLRGEDISLGIGEDKGRSAVVSVEVPPGESDEYQIII